VSSVMLLPNISAVIAMLKVLNMPHKVLVVPDVPLQP